MTQQNWDWVDRFVSHLEHLAGVNPDGRVNRRALADLRRGLNEEPGTVPAMYPHVLPWATASYNIQNTCFNIAALFGSHPMSTYEGDFGTSMYELATQRPYNAEAVERRFTTLLNSSREDMHVHLRQCIGLLRTHRLGVNWRRLLQDYMGWAHESMFVQRRWASNFWTPPREDSDGETPEADSGEYGEQVIDREG